MSSKGSQYNKLHPIKCLMIYSCSSMKTLTRTMRIAIMRNAINKKRANKVSFFMITKLH